MYRKIGISGHQEAAAEMPQRFLVGHDDTNECRSFVRRVVAAAAAAVVAAAAATAVVVLVVVTATVSTAVVE
ncbi:hypothetical protein M0802_001657 [Mischocyttarus mexicanus]|nr:hypothetical protein M0802_001657 [Mischocyttarus mexicanus]